MASAGIKIYDILLTGNSEILRDNEDETKDNGVTATLKLLNKTHYKKLILEQVDAICFHIIEDLKTKRDKYGDATQVFINYQENLSQPQGIPRKIICREFAKSELYNIARDPEDCTTKLELLKENLR